jgi:uncharacterized protein YndB with AHSA1/START domain
MQPFGCDISHRVYIAVPPDKVYDTITSSEGWDAFFTTGFEIDLKPGGVLFFRWKDWGPDFYTTSAEGRVVECRKPELFSFQWYPVGRENPTTVSFDLESKHGGTVVTLTESGYPDTAEARKMILDCATGWGEALTLLRFYLEKGVIAEQPARE